MIVVIEFVVLASTSEVTYWPVVLSKGSRMTLGAAVGTTHTAKPEVLSGITASEMALFGNSRRNEACPRTAPLTSMLAQPCDSVGAVLEITTLCCPPGTIEKV